MGGVADLGGVGQQIVILGRAQLVRGNVEIVLVRRLRRAGEGLPAL
jgi:hypothetical protein